MKKFSLMQMNAMIPAEFEQLREQGEEYRRELSNAVVGLISAPAGWQVNAEYRGEFGGLFPVQVRYTPQDGESYGVCLCSPGELSPGWLVVLISQDARLTRILHQSDTLEPEAVITLISRVAGLHRLNCGAGTVNAVLGVGVSA